MQTLVAKEKEPITPFISKVRLCCQGRNKRASRGFRGESSRTTQSDASTQPLQDHTSRAQVCTGFARYWRSPYLVPAGGKSAIWVS
jgi:hypothetical protein